MSVFPPEKSCEGKIRFPTWTKAYECIDELYAKQKAEEGTLHPYRCEHGEHIHVGHWPNYYFCEGCLDFHQRGDCVG